MSKLVIVESPTKSKTISKFLGKDYVVESSYGHIRDLPKGKLGVDTENNFDPQYVIPQKAQKNLTHLRKQMQKSDEVILATDEDREGEAIAWHLSYALTEKRATQKKEMEKKPMQRIVFHEITKNAIEEALRNPREIDMKLVNAQQARRILDRLVGYKLSPFLWKKVVRGLSAGRVQSVAVRLIIEREREIQAFKPEEYWSIEADFSPKNSDDVFLANLHAKDGKTIDKLQIKNKEEAEEITKQLNDASYKVENIEQKDIKKNPLPPFITSTLQQEASRRFGYPAKRTMMLAQNLYERGFITYHRTDSFNLAQGAVYAARNYLETKHGKEYIPEKPKFYKTRSKGAQEAHEAIRPAFTENQDLKTRAPEKAKLEAPQLKLYTLIWQRFMACQMNPAVYASTTVDIATNTPYSFRTTGSRQKFPGFLKEYPMKVTENELPELKEKQELDLEELRKDQHFTQPPARYSEATLVKALEKHGIGRPSTYASIISTIQDRNYVKRNEQKRLEPNEVGFLVTDLLTEHFPEIVDIEFTAKMESELDKIAVGEREWQKILEEFYRPFEEKLEKKYEEVEKANTVQEVDEKCPECGKNLVKRMGRFGWFYGCSGFPDCRHIKAIKDPKKELNVHCPKCVEGKLVEKNTKKGRVFYGCNRYPDCDFALWDKPLIQKVEGTKNDNQIVKCPECESVLVEKGKKISCSSKECEYKTENVEKT